MGNCVDKILAKFPRLTRAEANQLDKAFKNIEIIHKENSAAINKLSRGAITDFEISQLNTAKDNVGHAVAKHRLLNHIFQENFINNPMEGIISKVQHTNFNVSGKDTNLENISVNTNQALSGSFTNNLRNRDLLKYSANPKNLQDIIKAVKTLKKSYENSVNPAEQVAYVIAEINANVIRRLQRAGSNIKAHPFYIFAQTHNHDLILQDPTVWANNIVDKLDWDKTFGFGSVSSKSDAIKRLESLAGDIESSGYFGPSVGRSGKRQLIFKDDDTSWLKYNDDYGYFSLLEGIQNTIDKASKQIALFEVFGPRQLEMVDELIESVKTIQPRNKKGVNEALEKKIRGTIDVFTGVGNRVGEGIGSKTYSAVRTANLAVSLAVLGKSVFPAMEDIATSILVMKRITDKPIPIIASNVLFNTLKNVPLNRGKEMALNYEVALKGMQKELLEAIGPRTTRESGINNLLIGGLDKLMVLNGTTFVTNTMRQSGAELLGKAFTSTITKKSLNNAGKQVLAAADISPREVGLLRDLLKSSDSDVITPSLIRKSNIDVKIRNTLANKVGAFYTQNVNQMSPILRNKQKFEMGRGLPQDHPLRTIGEAVFLFRGTIGNIQNTVIENARASNPKGELNNLSAYSSLAKSMMVLGITSYTMNRLSEFVTTGESPDFDDEEKFVKDFTEALIGSGAAGIYGSTMIDVLGGNSGGLRVPSPSLEIANKLRKSLVKGDPDKFLRTMSRLIPYRNLILFDNEIRRNLIPLPID